MEPTAATSEALANQPTGLPTPEQLPDDPVVLKQMILELLESLQQSRRNEQAVQHRVEQLLRRLYGPRSERFRPDQPLLFELDTDAEQPAPTATASEAAAAEQATERPRRRCRPHGRRRLPEQLPRRPVHHELSVAERLCSCGQLRQPIGAEVSEQLDYQPASLFVWEHHVHKYACPNCADRSAQATSVVELTMQPSGVTDSATAGLSAMSGVLDSSMPALSATSGVTDSSMPALSATSGVTDSSIAAMDVAGSGAEQTPTGPVVVCASKPAVPWPRALPGPGLLADLIVSKYDDHLPLYRLERIYQRQGVLLPRSTTCDWLAACARLLRPLYQLMVVWVLQSRWLHTDDTTVRDRQLATTARLWCYLGDTTHPYNVFDFTATRQRDGPQTFLKKFRGYLHADAFSGYDALYLPRPSDGEPAIIEVACNAHARRKFYEARSSDAARSHCALGYYRQLYELERQAKVFDEEQRRRLRQELSVPILDKFQGWLQEQQSAVLPKSPIAQAIGYALNNWSALIRYTEAGFLSIDNNVAEREMKRIAIGRKNWLFVGSARGGETAAVLNSFTSTCRRLQIEPWTYLQDVLKRLPTTPAEQLTELLPDRWQATRVLAASPSPDPAAATAATSTTSTNPSN